MQPHTLHTIEHISLKVFLTCMIATATIAIVSIWLEWAGMQIAFIPVIPTFFIIGFASFLIWIPIVIYKLIEALKKN